ncbi:hypothetical protein A2230_09250 [candidate division WOR-1 bacterium RIFOXYA2_FULL_36_21]|uniref:Addiction module toxin RelE n=1 Tax=candidate division WOR-1 bacterium RIFOXYB2_FULL_36_35 TaxID=1802578 RepID=A0A1F4S3N7_UNCSA|nr:MAG: hypothetical protein A2230_09250 [candidate division WOR-1 bacterium RIFOXYA2_FULL_36_21]OGC15044.1 MAG: hypothetical protein A2290_09070 [candidate division WOR-1 bacterium RIFOXYB2_FULL_36_35]OGC18832.1 MAG: hypothetical protein A2282_05645 [candidate division WOR-1 bacterium RIFOXYA12_FULL_36_13]
MIFLTTALFERLFKKLDFYKQEEVKRAVSELVAFFDSGIKTEGLGLKQLRKTIWEIRASIKDRILFSLVDGKTTLLIIGNHDDIRKFLKNL